MVQQVVVGIVVALAALYALSKYLPASWRRKIVWLLTRGGASGQSRIVKWFDTGSSCASGCDTCKACEPPAPPENGRRVIKLHVKR